MKKIKLVMKREPEGFSTYVDDQILYIGSDANRANDTFMGAKRALFQAGVPVEIESYRIDETKIQIGDRVRSFDFAKTHNGKKYGRELSGDRACYVEGVVNKIVHMDGCDRYEIKVDLIMSGGKLQKEDTPTFVYPPVNGIKIAGSEERLTDFVEKI